jgi:hypothetical protein
MYEKVERWKGEKVRRQEGERVKQGERVKKAREKYSGKE